MTNLSGQTLLSTHLKSLCVPANSPQPALVEKARGQEGPRHTCHPEKDVPQPHDFEALGFTKTNP